MEPVNITSLEPQADARRTTNRVAGTGGLLVVGCTVREGVRLEQFGRRRSPGVDLAVQALTTAMPEETIRAVATGYTQALVSAYERALA